MLFVVLNIISKILTFAFAMGGIYFETRNKDSQKLNKWGKFMLLGTLISFGVNLFLEHQENLDKINTAKSQIDTISRNTSLLLDTTRQKLNAQFDTITKLNIAVKKNVDANQVQTNNQFSYTHQIQDSIKNLVVSTLSSTEKTTSLFIKWEFTGLIDSLTKSTTLIHKEILGISPANIKYYKQRLYIPPYYDRKIDKKIATDRTNLYSFLGNLIHTIPTEEGTEVSDDNIPEEIFGLISFDENYSAIIPFGQTVNNTNLSYDEKNITGVEKQGEFDYESDLPQIAYENNKSFSVDWYLHPSFFSSVVNYSDKKQILTNLMPDIVRVVFLYNIENFPLEPKNLANITSANVIPNEWYSLEKMKKKELYQVFSNSKILICPDGNSNKYETYELINFYKANYSIYDDPVMNYCDYVVFTFKKR